MPDIILTKRKSNSNIFSEMKQNISYIDLCRTMGWPYKERSGRIWIHSPFNPHDRNPSCCLYIGGGWKDYSTGEAGSDVISLYAKVQYISHFQAARELAKIFNIKIEIPTSNVEHICQFSNWFRLFYQIKNGCLCKKARNIFTIKQVSLFKFSN